MWPNRLVFLLWSGCSTTEKTDAEQADASQSNSHLSMEEQRVQNHASDLEDYTYDVQTFGEDTEHTLTVYRFKRTASTLIHAPDRSMKRFAFFWNDDVTATEEVNLVAEHTYQWWWENNQYHVNFTLLDADFSKRLYAFELNGKSTSTGEIRAGIDGFSDPDVRSHACRFNRSMLNFAWERVGQHIGDGECWTLINEALLSSSAHHAAHYRFGSLLTEGSSLEQADWSMVLPGDIIQFDQAYFEGDGYTTIAGEPNHTALIRSIDIPNHRITVYEQNSPIGGPTEIDTYAFDDLQDGGFYIYRAVPSEESPDIDHCDQPTDDLYAYEQHENQRSSGAIIRSIATHDVETFWLACQQACDQEEICMGFSTDTEQCYLHEEGNIVSGVGMTWYQKIR